MKLKPIDNRILFKRVDLEIKTAGGLFLGEIEKERDTGYGRVIAVGDGKKTESGLLPMEIKEGNLIAFNERIPLRMNYRGENYYIIRESDVFTIIEDDEVVEKPYTTVGTDYENMRKTVN